MTDIILIIAILVLIAFLLSIDLFIQAAKEKGYYEDNQGVGKLWFIGIFATPLVVGIYTASLPDLRLSQRKKPVEIDSELPEV